MRKFPKLHLIVTIPAYNEEKMITQVIKSIPRKLRGIDKIEVMVWSDGSTDQTMVTAKLAGADYVFSNKKNLGLAKTFNRATKRAVELGADIIVNTDADNQYDQKEISKLLVPIIEHGADMVSGDRQIQKLTHMPVMNKYGNILGSWTIRMLTGTKLNDASSGFRAYTRDAIKHFSLYSDHTYTHETIIQAVNQDMLVYEVPITFKKRVGGKSKLISSIYSHMKKSSATIIRTILMYKALKVLVTIGSALILLGMIGIVRFGTFYLDGNGSGHIQSLIFSSILISIGFNTILIGVIADLISINRKLLEGRN